MNEDENLGDPARGDRGGGIHVSRGGFRIPAFSLSIDLKTGELDGSPIVPELRIDTFEDWIQIARDGVEAAAEARRRALEVPRDDSESFNAALKEEFRASMVAITAAGIAIDSFYGSVKQHAPETSVAAESRDAAIFETLKRAFVLKGEQQKVARESLRQIFRRRDDAVHPPASWVKPVAHPVFNLGMEPRFVWFRLENAMIAQSFAARFIWLCVNRPKSKYEELVRWCGGITDQMAEPADLPGWVAEIARPANPDE